MLEFPRWKYALILVVLVLAALYALPNAYQKNPSVQITPSTSEARIDGALQRQVEGLLAEAGVTPVGTEIDDDHLLVRLSDSDTQTRASDALRGVLGENYSVALNLASTVSAWLDKLGAKPMSLGLDLQGGVHFVMQVDQAAALQTRVEGYADGIRTVLREARIGYSSVERRADNTIGVVLVEGADVNRARSEIASSLAGTAGQTMGSSAPQITVDGNRLTVRLSQGEIARIATDAVEQNRTVISNRINSIGVAEPVLQRQGDDRLVIQLPGLQDTAEAKRILGKTASLEFRLQADFDAPRGATESFGFREEGRPPVQLERELIITGDQVTDAQASFDENGRPQVNIRLDGHGGELMNRATRNNVGRSMAVIFIEQRPLTRYVRQMVDGVEQEVRVETFQEEKKIISLATIQSPLGSQFRITGLNGQGESSELALLLRAGGLAAPMYFAEERTIGPSLGAENIKLGVQAAMWGFLFVAIFMVLIYKFFGVLATIALLFNMVALTALMSMLNATLTLPGIAGIVLTMGMAVDANVLIFSRIREEIANGMSIQRAIHEGFDRAFSAILDGNLTTLLVGGILFAMGTGPIKGFAVTLSIGILTSMFTAIIVTRGMVNLIYGGRDLKKLWI